LELNILLIVFLFQHFPATMDVVVFLRSMALTESAGCTVTSMIQSSPWVSETIPQAATQE
jgi:hypothetical protein